MGASASGSPGEYLDPLNDVVERFSNLMLICFSILSVERILYFILQTIGFSLISLMSLGLLVGLTFKTTEAYTTFLTKLSVVGLVFIVLLPLQAMASSILYAHFFQSDYEQARRLIMEEASIEEGETQGPSTSGDIPSDQSWLDSLTAPADSFIPDSFNFSEKAEEIYHSLKDLYDSFLDLMVVFVFEAILLPLATLYIALKAIGVIFGENRLLDWVSAKIHKTIFVDGSTNESADPS